MKQSVKCFIFVLFCDFGFATLLADAKFISGVNMALELVDRTFIVRRYILKLSKTNGRLPAHTQKEKTLTRSKPWRTACKKSTHLI